LHFVVPYKWTIAAMNVDHLGLIVIGGTDPAGEIGDEIVDSGAGSLSSN
jgi:hypothetical protein